MTDESLRLQEWLARAGQRPDPAPSSPRERCDAFWREADRERKAKRWRDFWKYDAPAVAVVLLVTAAIVSCTVHVFTHDPTTTEEWQREYQEVQRKDAIRCQQLFGYWQNGLITDGQTKKLQACVQRFSK